MKPYLITHQWLYRVHLVWEAIKVAWTRDSDRAQCLIIHADAFLDDRGAREMKDYFKARVSLNHPPITEDTGDQVILTKKAWDKLTRLLIEIVGRADMSSVSRDAFSDFTHEVAQANPHLFGESKA